jgi:uncharacterized protein (TIRG00374 family)
MDRKLIISIFVTLVLMAILLSQIEIEDIYNTISSVPLLWVLAGFFLYIGSYFFRALRFYILLNGKVHIGNLFAVVSLHNLSINILPARLGELSYVYLVKRRGIKTGVGIATLIIARIFDLAAISLLFFVSVANMQNLPKMISETLGAMAVLLGLLVTVFLFLGYFKETSLKAMEGLVSKLNLGRFHITGHIMEKGREIAESFGTIHSRKQILSIFISSLFIWSLTYSVVYVLLNQMGIEADIWTVIIGATFPIFATILPLHSIGSFGTFEGAWALAFISLGVSREMAIATGFGYHILALLYMVILGAYGSFEVQRD